LLNFIKFQYQKLTDVEQDQLSLWMKPNNAVEITTIDSLMFKYFQRFQKKNGTSYKLSSTEIERRAMIQAIYQVQKKYPDSKIISPKNVYFLLDEIEWIQACQIEDENMYQNIE